MHTCCSTQCNTKGRRGETTVCTRVLPCATSRQRWTRCSNSIASVHLRHSTLIRSSAAVLTWQGCPAPHKKLLARLISRFADSAASNASALTWQGRLAPHKELLARLLCPVVVAALPKVDNLPTRLLSNDLCTEGGHARGLR